MKITRTQKFLILITAALVIYWIVLFVDHETATSANYWFSALTTLVPLVGGIAAMAGSHEWKEEGGHLHKGLIFLGLGLLFWAAGEIIWSYYNIIVHLQVPYPSWADLGWVSSEFFYVIGAIYLASASGGGKRMRKAGSWLFVGLVSVVTFVASYYILVVVANGGVLVTRHEGLVKTFLDVAYPFGDFVSITLSVALSGLYFKFLSPRYRAAIVCVLLSLVVFFAADAVFSYTTNNGTYYNGNTSDLLSLIGLFLMSFGALGFGKEVPKA